MNVFEFLIHKDCDEFYQNKVNARDVIVILKNYQLFKSELDDFSNNFNIYVNRKYG